MIKFKKELLKGKSIERLDEWYFRQNPTTDEIELTPFAEDKIAKAMKSYYGDVLKKLSLAAGDNTYLTKSKDMKKIKDEEATLKAKEFYESEYKKEIPKLEEMLSIKVQEYKDSHKGEFEQVEVLEGATYFDGEEYKSSGGNLYDLKCTSIKEAAIGYQTASAFLKVNPVDVNTPGVPKKIEMRAKNKKLWEEELKRMRQEVIEEYKKIPNANTGIPNDIFNPVRYKDDEEYTYSINWRATQKEAVDDEMLIDAANVYIASMM